ILDTTDASKKPGASHVRSNQSWRAFLRPHRLEGPDIGGEPGLPKATPSARPFILARAIGIQPGGNDPGLSQPMIEHHDAVIDSQAEIRQLQIILRPARQPWFHEILQFVTPVSKAAPKRKWEIHVVHQLVAREQFIEHRPWIAKLDAGRLPRPRQRCYAT